VPYAATKNRLSVYKTCVLFITATAVLEVLPAVCFSEPQQAQAGLQITAPANNAVVSPGQSISISVIALNNNSFTSVGVIGDIGATTLANSTPAQLSLAIPSKTSLGIHTLTAVGTTSTNQVLYSGPINIDVEKLDLPTRLRADPNRVTFGSSKGDTAPLRILATFSDGSYLDATESSNVAYASSNTSVATIDKNGVITSVAKGSASITATYTLGSQTISVSIPVTVPPPRITSTPTSLSFGSQNVGTSSATQTLTITNVSNNPGLTIRPISTLGDFSEADNCSSSSAIDVGATCTINVAFTPTAAGSRTGALIIPDTLDIVAPTIPLTGTGVGLPTTTTTIASSVNPSVYGQAVTLTGTVTPSNGTGAPTGSVTFSDGANIIGTASLASGQGALTVSSLTVGSHSLTAAYFGDANFLASTSPALSQLVNQASTATTLASSANP
jgi:uncharacterized protein YjdB